MRFVDLIDKKAHGESLTTEEIQQMVTGFVSGEIPDYQMSSMMMAILQRGMTSKETADLTMSMMHSGDVVDLSDLPGIKLDKHSTGGVGDTTTLIVAPLVGSLGVVKNIEFKIVAYLPRFFILIFVKFYVFVYRILLYSMV